MTTDRKDRKEFWVDFMNWLRAATDEELLELETLLRANEKKLPPPLRPTSTAVNQEVRRRVKRMGRPSAGSR
ncbi:hypothetical protein ACS0X5_18840 [Burkholderia gladioli]|uniref:hypothetical protein n=1 Tax=Burkholderia gladioli TaxID=28095 RepID=UPI0002E26A7C|nr:hypothetical protein [Burkholderia gladioli]MBU9426411.1 hypothetical protein [Burkholderia gladioli]MBW5287940.1 hypothetical protein [Burkholderia gladioli]MDN8063489.1 hypothetical protein [Burkholderia gladioli]